VAEGLLELPLDAGGAGDVVALDACDARGGSLPVHAEVEAPGATHACYDLPARVVARLLEGFPPEFFGEPVCALTRRRESERECIDVWLGSPIEPGFDWPRARAEAVTRLDAAGDAPARFRPRRAARVRVRIPGGWPGAGLRALRLRAAEPARARSGAAPTARQIGAGARIENGIWRIDVGEDGRVRWLHRPTGAAVEDALRVVDEADRGDSYSFDPLPGGERVERPERVAVSLAPGSQAFAGIRIDALYRVPESLAGDRRARSASRVALPVRIALGLYAGVDRLEIEVEADNRARDHRLRLQLEAPFRAERFAVESAFELAERPIEPAPGSFGSERPAEFPDGATPQRRYARLEGEGAAFVVANRGSTEVEALHVEGRSALALTLVRAVGWLSREDLARRPGHAGPPLETPGAQCPGPLRAEFALWSGAPGDPALDAAALGFADPPLVFSAGSPGGRLGDGARLVAWDDPAVQLSALEPRPGGITALRLLNASDRARSVQVRWNGPGGLWEVDLAGRSRGGARRPEPSLELSLRPWQLASLQAG
jgi:alpha-mannosidase/mannosylglycerate hydrolase